MIQINFNYIGDAIEVTPFIRMDNDHMYKPVIESASRLYFQIPNSETGGAHLSIENQPEINFLLPLGPWVDEASKLGLPNPLVLTSILSLGVGGLDFIVNGNSEKLLGMTSFRYLHKMLQGEDVQPNLDEFERLGIRAPRIFCRCINLFNLEPANYSDYDDALANCARTLNMHNMIPQFEILVDTWQMSNKQVFDFVSRCSSVLHDHVVLFDLVNEYDSRWQAINPDIFPKPAEVISSKGSGGSGTNPPTGSWDYASFHPRRDDKWLISIPKDSTEIISGWPGYEGVHCPLYYDEPMGFADSEREQRKSNPYDAFRLGAMLSLWTAGGVFHCDAGMRSEILTGNQLSCAEQFVRGFRNSVY